MSASAHFHDLPHSISPSIDQKKRFVCSQYATVRKCCNSLNVGGMRQDGCGEVCSSKLEKPSSNRHSHCSAVYKNLSTMLPRANLLRQKTLVVEEEVEGEVIFGSFLLSYLKDPTQMHHWL